jgi:hypothetical protein
LLGAVERALARAGDDRNHDSERDNQSLDHMLPSARRESLRGMRCRPARMTDEMTVQTGATRSRRRPAAYCTTFRITAAETR